MSELTDWLHAQVLERKATADKASQGPWQTRYLEEEDTDEAWAIIAPDQDVVGAGWEGGGVWLETDANHMVLNNPQDTIARCEAELDILNEHYGVQAFLEGIAQKACRRCSDRIPDDMRLPGGNLWQAVEPSPCKTIRLLASGYRHRPGYKAEEWAP